MDSLTAIVLDDIKYLLDSVRQRAAQRTPGWYARYRLNVARKNLLRALNSLERQP